MSKYVTRACKNNFSHKARSEFTKKNKYASHAKSKMSYWVVCSYILCTPDELLTCVIMNVSVRVGGGGEREALSACQCLSVYITCHCWHYVVSSK